MNHQPSAKRMPRPDLKPFIGIPFKDGGRSVDGCDCWGLVRIVFEAYGIKVEDYKIDCLDTSKIDQTIDQERGKWMRMPGPVEPCLIVMRIDPDHPKACNHLGVYVGGGKFLHTVLKRNSAMDHIDHPYFGRKIEGYYLYDG